MNTNFENLKIEKEKELEDLKKYQEKADQEVKEIRAMYAKNKDKVLNILTESILNVQLSLPKVVVGNFEETMEKK